MEQTPDNGVSSYEDDNQGEVSFPEPVDLMISAPPMTEEQLNLIQADQQILFDFQATQGDSSTYIASMYDFDWSQTGVTTSLEQLLADSASLQSALNVHPRDLATPMVATMPMSDVPMNSLPSWNAPPPAQRRPPPKKSSLIGEPIYPGGVPPPGVASPHSVAPPPSTSNEPVRQMRVFALSVNELLPIQTIPLAQYVNTEQHGISPSICRPAFAPDGSGRFVCGTEEQEDSKKNSNLLILGILDDEQKLMDYTGVPRLVSYPVIEHLRDFHWIDHQRIVFALNDKVGLIYVDENNTILESVVFPSFHKDTIREIAVNPFYPQYIVSGGFDCNVFVTDVTRLHSDIQRNERRSENSLFPCKDVVGSVNWHPKMPSIASCTTDVGMLHIFDIRTALKQPALVHDFQKPELYCHAYPSENEIALGFGDGSVQLFDWRLNRPMGEFKDPFQQTVGDLRATGFGTDEIVLFGNPCVTMWNVSQGQATLKGRIAPTAQYDENYHTTGAFRINSDILAVCDTLGMMNIYNTAGILQRGSI